MELKEYINYENRYFEKMVGCKTWEEFTSMRDRYIQFVINCCRWDKVKAISRKRYRGLNNARTKHFAMRQNINWGVAIKREMPQKGGYNGISDTFSPKRYNYPYEQK